jgi:PIN domain nuclease of toxin-antitoxin system
VTKVVLDTSAFLAVANVEPGAEKVHAVLRRAVISSVNLSEILSKLVRKGMTLPRAEEYVRQFVAEVVAFDTSLASLAAELDLQTRAFGLSLGDRACLALGKSLNALVLTADQVWAKVDLGISIELIRSTPSH